MISSIVFIKTYKADLTFGDYAVMKIWIHGLDIERPHLT